MFQIWKLFGKLYFGLDDPNGGGGEPSGQPPEPNGNAPEPNAEPVPTSPTDFVELEGVKVPQSTFEKIARERFKGAFDAEANRDKWQAENTREAQRLKQLERDAEAYRALRADHRNQPQPRNEFEALREEFIKEQSEFYPDADPQKLRSFLSKQFDWNARLSGHKANEALDPFRQQQANDFEQKFLAAHPDVKPGTQEYQEIAETMERGFNAEEAYDRVMGWGNPERRKSLIQKENETAIKAKDDERLKKLKANPTTSQQGDKPVTGNRSEKIWRAMEKHGLARE